MQGIFYSPFIVPLGAFAVAIVAIIAGVFGQNRARQLKADQRMGMLARGIPLAEVEAVLNKQTEEERRSVPDPMRKLGNARRTAVVLISCGVGMIGFFGAMTLILRQREVMAGMAIGFIPLAIGLGFVVDYRLQKREMARFGLEVAESDAPFNR